MKKKICVLLDTNIWVYSTKMLRSPLGSALLYLIRKNQIKIILPEVVEMEIRKHILKHGIDNVEKIEKGYSVIEKLIGERDNFDLPNKEDFINAADERFNELDSLIRREKFIFEDAKNSLIRIMDDLPPNSSNNQQFKDSCIWEVIKRNIKKYELHFITTDKAFFTKNKSKYTINEILSEELKELGEKAYFYISVKEYLKTITKDSPILEKEELINLIANKIDKEKLLNRFDNCMSIDRLSDNNLKAYYTENSKELFVQFEMLFEVTYIEEDESVDIDGFIKAIGQTSYNVTTKNIEKINYDSLQLLDSNKNILRKHAYIRVGSINSSRKKHIYRHLINTDDLNLDN